MCSTQIPGHRFQAFDRMWFQLSKYYMILFLLGSSVQYIPLHILKEIKIIVQRTESTLYFIIPETLIRMKNQWIMRPNMSKILEAYSHKRIQFGRDVRRSNLRPKQGQLQNKTLFFEMSIHVFFSSEDKCDSASPGNLLCACLSVVEPCSADYNCLPFSCHSLAQSSQWLNCRYQGHCC